MSLPQCSVNIIPQDHIDDEPVRFTTLIPPLGNQAILPTPTIIVSTVHYSSQYFLTINSPILNTELTVITSCFKDE